MSESSVTRCVEFTAMTDKDRTRVAAPSGAYADIPEEALGCVCAPGARPTFAWVTN